MACVSALKLYYRKRKAGREGGRDSHTETGENSVILGSMFLHKGTLPLEYHACTYTAGKFKKYFLSFFRQSIKSHYSRRILMMG